MRAMQHTASATKAYILTCCVWLMTGVAAHAAFQQTPNQMNTFIEIRITNQSIPEALRAIAAAADIEVKSNDQLNKGDVSDWKASGKLHEVLEAFSKEHALCMHFDGLKLDVTTASSASLEVMSIVGDAKKAKRKFHFSIPWSSSNAVTYDKTAQLAKICGSAEIIETAKRNFEQPSEKKINIIRYSIPSN